MPSSFFNVSPTVLPAFSLKSSPDNTVTGRAVFEVDCGSGVLMIILPKSIGLWSSALTGMLAVPADKNKIAQDLGFMVLDSKLIETIGCLTYQHLI